MDSVLLYFAKSGICLALFYGIYWIFLRKETFFAFNRFYLMLSAVFALAAPLVRIPSPFAVQVMVEPAGVVNVTASEQVHSIELTNILLVVYLLGAGFFLVRFLFQLVRLGVLVRRYGIHRLGGLRVVFTDKDVSPFSFLNIVFINKSTTTEKGLDDIIAHELVHIRQLHSIDIILAELLLIIQWCNPFVWPYRNSLKETHEYLADEAVLAQGCDTAEYQMLIFEQFVGTRLFVFANSFNHSQIKRRIAMMTKNKSRKWARGKVFFVLPVLAVLILAFARPRVVEQPNPLKTLRFAPAAPIHQEVFEDAAYAEAEKETKGDKTKSPKAKSDDETKKNKEIAKKIAAEMEKIDDAIADAKSDEEKKELELKKKQLQEKIEYLKQEEKKKKMTAEEEESYREKKAKDLDADIKTLEKKIALEESEEIKKELELKKAQLEKTKQKLESQEATSHDMEAKEKLSAYKEKMKIVEERLKETKEALAKAEEQDKAELEKQKAELEKKLQYLIEEATKLKKKLETQKKAEL